MMKFDVSQNSMKDQFVIFKIIQDFESKKTKTKKAILIISIILTLIGAPILIYYFNNETLNTTYAVIGFVAITISGFSYYLSNKTKTIGKVLLNETSISGDSNKQSFSFALSDIVLLDFKCSGFEGEPYLYNPLTLGGSRTGTKNYLTIKTMTSETTYQIFVENEMQINILKRLLIYYKNIGMNIWTKDIG
jgi:hypothetical protein